MPTPRDIAQQIVAREGGFVNDPDDPGGATNHGVTLATLRRLGRDLTGDGRVTVADVHALSQVQAVDIYLEHYFRRPGIDGLPEPLQASVFDMQVNAGTSAVKLLQNLCRKIGVGVAVDGIVGPQTRAAAARALALAPDHLVDAYGIERRNYYYRLADARPALRKFARRRDGGKGGWITRAEEFMSPRYRLTDRQHLERVSQWD
jgi:lysozyme family protein